MDIGRLSAYLEDFQEKITLVDDHIFVRAGHPSSPVFLYENRPSKIGGYHLADLASYYPQLDLPLLAAKDPFTKRKKQTAHFSAYLIYVSEVAIFMNLLFERNNLNGIGDHALKEFWLRNAIALVRLRLHVHIELFPGVKFRTKASMVKYRHLFTQTENEIEGLQNIEKEYQAMDKGVRNDPSSADVCWTLILVERAFEAGASLGEALEYIALG